MRTISNPSPHLSSSLTFHRDFADAPGRVSPVPGAPSLDELIVRAQALAPRLRERAAQTERERRVSDEVTAWFREAGFFKLMQPARYGGYEYGFSAFVDIISELGRGCTSSAWACSLGAVHQWFVGTFGQQAQDDVWAGDPDAIVCVSYAPVVKAKAVAGGYQIEGKWQWASNCDNSQWAMLAVQFEAEDANPAPHAGFLLVPRNQWAIEDNWYVAGQSGTGSKTVWIDGPVLVPRHRKLTFAQSSSGNPPGAAVNPNPVYRIPFLSAVPTCLVSPILGTAQGAIDAFIDMAASRVTRGAVAGGGNRMCDFFPVQAALAEATAKLDAARLLIWRDTAEVERYALDGRAIGVPQRIRNRRDHAFATQLCKEAVDGLFNRVGGGGLALEQPIQRMWRDANAIAKHISLNWDGVSAMAGQHMLGLEPKGQY